MIMTDRDIRSIIHHPFTSNQVNPASYDLRLGNEIAKPRWFWLPGIRQLAWRWFKLRGIPTRHTIFVDGKKTPNPIYWGKPRKFTKYILAPGEFVLAHSLEVTHVPNDAAAFLFLKSSTGRRGLEHSHAGYGDPGFVGQWTFELSNTAPWPIELVAGERMLQVVFAKTTGVPHKLYGETGHYQNQRGPTAPRA